MTLFNLLAQSAERYPSNGAVYLGARQVLTFAELEDRALRLGSALLLRGRSGDRILIASKNCAEYPELMFAAWAVGMVIVPVNAKLHEREIMQIVDDAQPIVLFASAKLAAVLAPMLGDEASAPEVIVIGDTDYQAILAHDPVVPAQLGPDDLAWLFFTSGTTGRSKGAMLSHRNLLAMAIAHLADFDSAGADSSLIHAAPMSHGSGLCILPYIARGARQVVPMSSSYDPAEFIDLCEVHPRVSAFLAPTMVQRLRIEAQASGRRPATLNLIIYGGGPMYVDEIQRSLAALGQVFAQLYGQGEAPMTITGLRRDDHDIGDEAVLGSVGWPRSGVEVAIFDEEDRRMPHGQTGEIVCRGDVVMQGYWKNPAATAVALRNGWLHTGDIGTLGPDGQLTLRDRSKDVIISAGTNIYPREVEEALLRHPEVAEVAVVGQPDPEWGETIVAFIVREGGMTVSEKELDAHCLSLIARFKRPKTYIFLAELPKNSYGKVLKRELAAKLVHATRTVLDVGRLLRHVNRD
jgi:acyl-CoA synthetase (AMP-forming)/AMP-acid ligase II